MYSKRVMCGLLSVLVPFKHAFQADNPKKAINSCISEMLADLKFAIDMDQTTFFSQHQSKSNGQDLIGGFGRESEE